MLINTANPSPLSQQELKKRKTQVQQVKNQVQVISGLLRRLGTEVTQLGALGVSTAPLNRHLHGISQEIQYLPSREERRILEEK